MTVATSSMMASTTSMKTMERVFARSEQVHSQSLATIMRSMSPRKALQVLEKRNLTSPALVQLTSHLHGKQSNLRKKQPSGYAGIDGARKLLNDMIYESMGKYDSEIARCSEYYSAQCAAMDECRGQISASNYIAANSRSMILDSQATINKCEQDIPTRKYRLKQHLLMCKHELSKMRSRLAVIEADISILTTILQMTDCKALLQTKVSLLHCDNSCSKTSFITFDHDDLKEKISHLQSSVTQGLLKDNFKDLAAGIAGLQSLDFFQLSSKQTPVVNTTYFNNPPLPRTEVPQNPCDDPSLTPTMTNKNANKCTIAASPHCDQLQERFLLIQSGVEDERDNLLGEIQMLEHYRDETKGTLEAEIQNDQNMLQEAQTKLADATTKEADAGEKARQTAKEHDELNSDLKSQMKTCSSNYINFETEMCALKKIRGELYKMSSQTAFFQDCVVAKWDPEECSSECGGGQQTLSRAIITHPNGGAKCLPLTAVKTCNAQPCPVDCKLEEWQGWSKCSAQCGGGVQQRLRNVERAMRFEGKPCDATSETRACNAHACEKECELSRWSEWSQCSKVCDGGTQKRMKFVKQEPVGQGSCPDMWSPKRLEYKECNKFSCFDPQSHQCTTHNIDTNLYTCQTLPPCCEGFLGMGKTEATVQCLPESMATNTQYTVKCPAKPLQCKEELDIVFLLDGSGSLGDRGWEAEKKAATTFVDAFTGTGAQAHMAVILYSGPKYWSGVYKCMGKQKGEVNLETDCKIKTVTHLTADMAAVKTAITGLEYPKGSTLTSLALTSAKAELNLGRKDAKSIVVVITDGRPMSYRKTYWAARDLRKVARLVWVPVTRYAPLRKIKKWATRRWKENVVRVKTFDDLEKADVVNHVVANICPKK